MVLVPVESSNVAAIGYNAECRLLRVQFKDGSTYDYSNIDEAQHQTVMTAPSKGKAIAELRRRGTRLTDGQPIKLREQEVAGPLNTFQEDACCGIPLSKAIASGKLAEASDWLCPRCGAEWRPEMRGPIRVWVPHDFIQVIR